MCCCAGLSQAQAVPDKRASAKDPCAHVNTQFEDDVCSQKQADKAGARLKRIYPAILDVKEEISRNQSDDAAVQHIEDEKVKLRESQQLWEQYRDAQCDAAGF